MTPNITFNAHAPPALLVEQAFLLQRLQFRSLRAGSSREAVRMPRRANRPRSRSSQSHGRTSDQWQRIRSSSAWQHTFLCKQINKMLILGLT